MEVSVTDRSTERHGTAVSVFFMNRVALDVKAIYTLPQDRPGLMFHAEIGITDSSRGRGSAVFIVETGNSLDGPWQSLYTSDTLRGAQPAVTVEQPLGNAKYLRLRTTDAGDGINSDHAVWGDARLTVKP